MSTTLGKVVQQKTDTNVSHETRVVCVKVWKNNETVLCDHVKTGTKTPLLLWVGHNKILYCDLSDK